MKRPSRRAARTAAALCMAFGLLAAPRAWANWESDYKDGKTAYEKGDYSEAIKLMRSAIADKPQEKDKAVRISGMFFDPYVPHYYLGMAFYKTEQYGKAIREFETSQSMGVIQKLDLLDRSLRDTKTQAEAELSARKDANTGQGGGETAPPTTGTPPGGGIPPDKGPEPTPPPKGPDLPIKRDPVILPSVDLDKAVADAASDIAGAKKFLVDSKPYVRPEESGQIETLMEGIRNATTADQAKRRHTELNGAVSDLRGKVAARRKAESDAAAKALAAARDQASGIVREAELFGREKREILEAGERSSLDSRIAATKSAGTVEGVQQAANRLKSELGKLRAQVSAREAVAAGASAMQQYTAGATAYYEGRYDTAVASLKQASQSLKDDPGPQALLGSALYRQYLLSRPPDEGLKNAAASAFRAAVSIQRGYTLDESTFPPKVVAFFRLVSGSR